jgi:hypothetical protein
MSTVNVLDIGFANGSTGTLIGFATPPDFAGAWAEYLTQGSGFSSHRRTPPDLSSIADQTVRVIHRRQGTGECEPGQADR